MLKTFVTTMTTDTGLELSYTWQAEDALHAAFQLLDDDGLYSAFNVVSLTVEEED